VERISLLILVKQARCAEKNSAGFVSQTTTLSGESETQHTPQLANITRTILLHDHDRGEEKGASKTNKREAPYQEEHSITASSLGASARWQRPFSSWSKGI